MAGCIYAARHEKREVDKLEKNKTILVLKNLTKEFPGVRAVSDASLEIKRGKYILS